MTLGELGKQYEDRYKAWEQENDRLLKEREEIDKKLKELSMPHWIDDVVRPIGNALVKLMPGYHVEVSGPFGLDCLVWLHLVRDGVEGKAKYHDGNMKSMAFRPRHDSDVHIGIVDFSVNSGRYASGTIGEMNRMNYATNYLEPDMPVEDMIQLLE